MSRPLLAALPLFLTGAHASPPVDTTRVTGNVSTEHTSSRERRAVSIAHPVTQACRVTGNILRLGAKRGDVCRLRDGQESLNLWIGLTTTVDDRCEASGTLATVESGPACVLEDGTVVPLAFVAAPEGV